jgi:cell division transport system permease protein
MTTLRSDLNLRGDSSRRFLPLIIAFMVFLASLATAAAMIVSATVDDWGRGLTGTLTIQIPPLTGDKGGGEEAALDDVLRLVRATPGVATARALDKSESRALLDPWLGAADGETALPLPRLIDVRLNGTAAVDVGLLRTRVQARVAGAVVEDHGHWLGQLAAVTRSVRIAAFAVVAVIALAAVLTVIYATRSGIAVHYPTIEVLHLIGARDDYIARQFERQALLLGLLGSVLGFGAAALVLVAFGRAAPAMEGAVLPALEPAGWDWAVLAVVPLAATAIATLTARLTVLRTLARML